VGDAVAHVDVADFDPAERQDVAPGTRGRRRRDRLQPVSRRTGLEGQGVPLAHRGKRERFAAGGEGAGDADARALGCGLTGERVLRAGPGDVSVDGVIARGREPDGKAVAFEMLGVNRSGVVLPIGKYSSAGRHGRKGILGFGASWHRSRR
jgi:hypothetical protein